MLVDNQGRPIQSEPPAPQTRDFSEGKDYTISKYEGKYDNYECVHCQFATLFLSKLEEHFQYESYHQHKWAHPVPPEQQLKESDGPKAVY